MNVVTRLALAFVASMVFAEVLVFFRFDVLPKFVKYVEDRWAARSGLRKSAEVPEGREAPEL